MEYLLRAQKSIRRKLLRAPRLYLALDYDGTLTRIVNDPEHALLPKRTKELLQSIAAKNRCFLIIVSGRRVVDLIKLVDIDRAYYVGNHGLEIRGPGYRFVGHNGAKKLSHCLPELSRKLNQRLFATGAVLENKGLTLSVHYRNVRRSSIPVVLSTVRQILQDYDMFGAIFDKKVIDIRPNLAWNKGSALEVLRQHLGRYPMVYIGDDRTDEDAFVKLKDALTVLVSCRPRSSGASYYLKSTRDVAVFLRLFNSWIQETYGRFDRS